MSAHPDLFPLEGWYTCRGGTMRLVGVVVVVCGCGAPAGGAGSATAGELGGECRARAVLELHYDLSNQSCGLSNDCCPEGFQAVGIHDDALVCLEL